MVLALAHQRRCAQCIGRRLLLTNYAVRLRTLHLFLIQRTICHAGQRRRNLLLHVQAHLLCLCVHIVFRRIKALGVGPHVPELLGKLAEAKPV